MTTSRTHRCIAAFLSATLIVANVGALVLTAPQPAQAVTQMVLFWDNTNGSVPTGWTQDTSYNNYMLRGNSTAGGTGGSDTAHSHTITNSVTGTSANPVSPQQKKGTVTVADDIHTHNITSSSTGTAGSVPAYRELMVMTYDGGVPTVLPAKAIALFDTTGAFGVSGFTQYSAQNGTFIRGAATAGGTGGSNALHQHTSVSIDTGSPNTTQTVMVAGTAYYGSSIAHTHSVTGGTTDTDGDIRPPYADVVLATVDSADTPIPTGMIAMFNGSPDVTWSVLSNGGGAFNVKYMSGAATYTAGLGSATHIHNKTGGYTFNTWTAATGMGSGVPAKAVAGTHSHALTTPTFSTANNAPAYKDVIIAKKLAVLGVTAPANVTLTTGNPGTTIETTFGTGELVAVTEGGAGWSLTVQMTAALTKGLDTIPIANVKLRTDGIPASGDTTGDTYTLWSGVVTNTNEAATGTYSLDISRSVGTRSSGTGGDVTNIRPTIQIVMPPGQPLGDYTNGNIRFTVA
ncbi:MAG: hypothetical protein V1719_00945 [Patescibacteria group bacterium]